MNTALFGFRTKRAGARAGIGGRWFWAVVGTLTLLATTAKADPCEAPLPSRPGQTFSGRVDYIGDGDSLCIRTPKGLVEVRLGDFDAPELRSPQGAASKRYLVNAARGRIAVCTVTRGRSGRTISRDRVIAVCRIGGRRLGDVLRANGAPEGGN